MDWLTAIAETSVCGALFCVVCLFGAFVFVCAAFVAMLWAVTETKKNLPTRAVAPKNGTAHLVEKTPTSPHLLGVRK